MDGSALQEKGLQGKNYGNCNLTATFSIYKVTHGLICPVNASRTIT
jgi:hypothetical protein